MVRRRKTGSVIGKLSKRAARLRSDASKTLVRLRKRSEKAVGDGWEAALEALPVPARRAVRDARGTLRRLTADLDRRRARALKVMEKRGEDLMERFEKGAVEAVKPVIHRLDVASKSDLERLSRRIAKLEGRAHGARKVKHAAAA
jgi:hypothetical protein